MTNLRPFVTAVILGVTVSIASYAATAPTGSRSATTNTTAHRHGRRQSLMGQALGKVSLSADQKTQIHSIFAQAKPQFLTLRAETKASRESLATVPPTDPSYPSVVAAAQSNASARVQLRANIWSQVFAVLTPEQQAQLPSLVAAAQAERRARRAAWQSQHSAS